MLCRVLALSTFYNDKGSGLFDKDFLNDPNMYYNICLDEFNREKNEKKGFDIVYAFVNQLENLVRSTKRRTRVICVGNTLEEASDLLGCLNFTPLEFGRYKVKKKRAVIDYIKPSAEYLKRREGTIADLLTPEESTFTNELQRDVSQITKKRLKKPTCIIQFGKNKKFTVWDNNVIAKWNREKVAVIAMRPYMDTEFIQEKRDAVIQAFDLRGFRFKDMNTQIWFKRELELLKPRK